MQLFHRPHQATTSAILFLRAAVTIKKCEKEITVCCRQVYSLMATCSRHAVDKFVVSPASLQRIRVMWFEL
jgi:hypothetical protein